MKKFVLGGLLIVLIIILFFLFPSSKEKIEKKVKSVETIIKDVALNLKQIYISPILSLLMVTVFILPLIGLESQNLYL